MGGVYEQCRSVVCDAPRERARALPPGRDPPPPPPFLQTPGGNPQMMGCVVGRFINRIANATFVNADGAVVRLEANLPTGAANHGGGTAGGWCTQRWAVAGTTTDSVTFSLTSPAGFQGFPGTVVANVTYRMAADGALTATLTATADAVTAVNLAPHPYFNLDGAASRTNVRGHALQTPATLKTVLNPATLLPTGDVVSTNGTAFDFRNATLLGARWDAIPAGQAEAGVGGYEMQYVLGGHDGAAARAAVVAPCARAGVTPAATLSSPTTGRTLTLSTNAPAVVVYAGTHLGGRAGRRPRVAARRTRSTRPSRSSRKTPPTGCTTPTPSPRVGWGRASP